ncbi:MAG: class IV adenylate cyclase [Acidobacteriia bacterium]|nr:class IV adenylate cyclase [Terriglobia bacterium]
MDQPKPRLEVEIKLRLPDAATGKRKLRQAGFRVSRKRILETNVLFDTADGRLRREEKLIRLRYSSPRWVLTFKGGTAIAGSRYKIREEVETAVADGAALERILREAGLQSSFYYEKYRTEFRRGGERGCAMLDETPAGMFLELEGSGAWIDRTAKRLGFCPADYITDSYAMIWTRECEKRGADAKGDAGMTFA